MSIARVSRETLPPAARLHRLEVDLILGSWANENVPTLSAEELEQFEEVLKLETVDVYNIITGKQEIPEVCWHHKYADRNHLTKSRVFAESEC